MEKKLYNVTFIIMHHNGKQSPMLDAYMMAENWSQAEQMFIQTYANGDKSRFSIRTAPKDVPLSAINKLEFYYYTFRLKDEKGHEIGNTLHDLIPAQDHLKARYLFLAKYSNGDEKRLWFPTPQCYKYDELDKISWRDIKTYDFFFQMKNEKGQCQGDHFHMLIDAVDSREARDLLIAAVADGDEKKVWVTTPKEMGLALPTQIRKFKEAEKQRLKEEEKAKKEFEREAKYQAEKAEKEMKATEEKNRRKTLEENYKSSTRSANTASPTTNDYDRSVVPERKKTVDQDIDSEINEGMQLLKEHKFVEAQKLFLTIAKKNANNGKAYMGLVMAHNECPEVSDLTKKHLDISDEYFNVFSCYVDDNEIGNIVCDVLHNEENAILKETDEFLRSHNHETKSKKSTHVAVTTSSLSVEQTSSPKKEIKKKQQTDKINAKKKSHFLLFMFSISFLSLSFTAITKNSDRQTVGIAVFVISFAIFFYTLLIKSIKAIFKRKNRKL